MADHVLAVDLGGTRMRAAVVTPQGEVLDRRTQPTPSEADCPDALWDLVGDVLEQRHLTTAVLGVPGRVDYAGGRLEHAPNLPPHWPGALREDLLRDRLGLEVALANDADLAAVGEARFGAGRAWADVAYVTVSTGIGAGVLLGGRLVAGRRSLAEVGHTVIDVSALADGRPATLEARGSGTALARLAEDAGLPADGAAVTALVRDGDPAARAVLDEVVQAVAVGVTNLAWTFSPEVVVLGGGLGRNADLLVDPLTDHLRSHGPPDLPEPIVVTTVDLGDDAALVGAAAWHDATADQPRRDSR